eukprot:164474-Hanusia_phi.AAC.1
MGVAHVQGQPRRASWGRVPLTSARGCRSEPRGSSGEHSAAIGVAAKWPIPGDNQRTGFSEVELVQKMIRRRRVTLEDHRDGGGAGGSGRRQRGGGGNARGCT